jgi:hypothetical protein
MASWFEDLAEPVTIYYHLTQKMNQPFRVVVRKNNLEVIRFETFFQQASLNPNAPLITGLICGYRIEDIENPLTRQVRYLDKLVDELAKGRKMEKILRQVG